MKTTKRGKLLMLACAALVAVLACLPLLWVRAQDARMFGTVNQSSGLYESREVSGDDFYLLQQVKNRTQMNRTDWMGFRRAGRHSSPVYPRREQPLQHDLQRYRR